MSRESDSKSIKEEVPVPTTTTKTDVKMSPVTESHLTGGRVEGVRNGREICV